MENVQKFLDEAVREYNRKTLTNHKLRHILEFYVKEVEEHTALINAELQAAFHLAEETFHKHKGKTVEKLTPCLFPRIRNPYYE